MKEVQYDFVELESEKSFNQLGNAFGGTCKPGAISFDNTLIKGDLIKKIPEEGLWIRKWKLTVLEKVTLHRLPAPPEDERKFNLLFFLNPSIFELKKDLRKLPINSQKNTIFVSNDTAMDFSVLPKQPFYVLDISFSAGWLSRQLHEVSDALKKLLQLQLESKKTMVMEPCQLAEYKTLHNLDALMQPNDDPQPLIGMYAYQLIFSFLNRVCEKDNKEQKKRCFHYEQMLEVATLITKDLKSPLTIGDIAQKVSMSPSSLLRHFRLVYGKSLQEYYVQMKMEFAKKLIKEKRYTVKRVASLLGYHQASPFIETFTKQFGCSPGSYKAQPVF